MSKPTKEQIQQELNKRIAQWQNLSKKYPFLNAMLTDAQKTLIFGGATLTKGLPKPETTPDPTEDAPNVQTVEFFCEFRPVESIKIFSGNNLFYQFPKEHIDINSNDEPVGSNSFAQIQMTITNNNKTIQRTDGRLFEKDKEYYAQYSFYDKNAKLSSKNTAKFVYDGSLSITFVFSSTKEQGIDENLNKKYAEAKAKLKTMAEVWGNTELKIINGIFDYFNKNLHIEAFDGHVEAEDVGFWEDAGFKSLAFVTNAGIAKFAGWVGNKCKILSKIRFFIPNPVAFVGLTTADIAIGKALDLAEDALVDMRKEAAKDANDKRKQYNRIALGLISNFRDIQTKTFMKKFTHCAITIGEVVNLEDAQQLLDVLDILIKTAPKEMVAEKLVQLPFAQYLQALNNRNLVKMQELTAQITAEIYPPKAVKLVWETKLAEFGLAYEVLSSEARKAIADAEKDTAQRTEILRTTFLSKPVVLTVNLANQVLNKDELIKILKLENATANKEDSNLDNVAKYAIENPKGNTLTLTILSFTSESFYAKTFFDINVATMRAEINLKTIGINKIWQREISVS